MRIFALTFLLLANTLFGESLQEVIQQALQSNPSLEVIQARLEANKHDIDVADQFANPELAVTTNTLPSSQKMSQSVITLKQNIPYYSKRQKRQNISLAEEELLTQELRKARVKLVTQIKLEAYTLWELQELVKIVDEYIAITQNNITLYESYTSIDENQHMGIMKAELSLSDLKIQKVNLQSKIEQSYARLSALVAHKVENLEIDLTIASKPQLQALKASLTNNPDIALQEKEIFKQNALVENAEINNYPDFNLLAGYAYRKEYDNYFNIGFAMTLPIYGTEDAKEEKERALLLAKQSQKADTQLQVDAEFATYFAQMQSSYDIYHIIQDDALPQVAHMFELSTSSISTGSDLFKYIDVLFQKLDLEKKSIEAVLNYNKAHAKIEELQGKEL